MDIKVVKQAIREKAWRILEESNAATFPRPVYDRIPNFVGSQEAVSGVSILWVISNYF